MLELEGELLILGRCLGTDELVDREVGRAHVGLQVAIHVVPLATLVGEVAVRDDPTRVGSGLCLGNRVLIGNENHTYRRLHHYLFCRSEVPYNRLCKGIELLVLLSAGANIGFGIDRGDLALIVDKFNLELAESHLFGFFEVEDDHLVGLLAQGDLVHVAAIGERLVRKGIGIHIDGRTISVRGRVDGHVTVWSHGRSGVGFVGEHVRRNLLHVADDGLDDVCRNVFLGSLDYIGMLLGTTYAVGRVGIHNQGVVVGVTHVECIGVAVGKAARSSLPVEADELADGDGAWRLGLVGTR